MKRAVVRIIVKKRRQKERRKGRRTKARKIDQERRRKAEKKKLEQRLEEAKKRCEKLQKRMKRYCEELGLNQWILHQRGLSMLNSYDDELLDDDKDEDENEEDIQQGVMKIAAKIDKVTYEVIPDDHAEILRYRIPVILPPATTEERIRISARKYRGRHEDQFEITYSFPNDDKDHKIEDDKGKDMVLNFPEEAILLARLFLRNNWQGWKEWEFSCPLGQCDKPQKSHL